MFPIAPDEIVSSRIISPANGASVGARILALWKTPSLRTYPATCPFIRRIGKLFAVEMVPAMRYL
jgi:hypothetical protein